MGDGIVTMHMAAMEVIRASVEKSTGHKILKIEDRHIPLLSHADVFDLTCAIEESFNIDLTDDECAAIPHMTINQIADMVELHCAKPTAAHDAAAVMFVGVVLWLAGAAIVSSLILMLSGAP